MLHRKNTKAVSEVREDLAEILNTVIYREERVVIQRHGRNIAALVPLKDLEILESLQQSQGTDPANPPGRKNKITPWEELAATVKL